MHLLAAPMLFGLILASVPIIIHLWNKRQFRVVEWAPMKYLRLTIKTNRKRMRIEQLLLLAVRTLVIVLLFLALARPSLSNARAGGWLASRARTSRIVVIDDSLSMGYLSDRRTAFDAAKEAAAQLIRSIGAQDSVTVLLTSHPSLPIARDVSLDEPSRLIKEITDFHPTDTAGDFAAVFKKIEEILAATSHPQKEIVLITDLRQNGWNAGVSSVIAGWATEAIDMKVIDVGSRETENIVLSRFEQEDAVALPGAPLKIRAAIRNDTTGPLRGAQAKLEIDGRPRPLVLPDLPPGQTTELPLTVTLPRPGQHVLKLMLPDDRLAADNVRWLSSPVRSEIKIAMIDGQVGSRPFESSTDFLQVAFTAGADPWQISRRADSEWKPTANDSQLGGADLLVLADVASLSPLQVSTIEKLVSAGMGLMIFGGEHVDTGLYEQLLHRGGAGLLPGQISRAVDSTANGLVIEPFNDSPLLPLSKISPEALARIRPKRFLTVSVDPNHDRDVRVLATWNDSESHPAAIEKRFGRGRVILWTLSADRQWGDWPVDPTYVLAMRSAALSTIRPDAAGSNFTAGQSIAYPIEAGQVVHNPTITGPDQSTPLPLIPMDQALRHELTSHAGHYKLEWRDASDKEQVRSLCASGDSAESNLAPIDQAELTKLLTPLRPTFVHWGASGVVVAPEQGREIWRNVITFVLVLAGFETMLAMWVGRER